jgi:hypothetical protein
MAKEKKKFKEIDPYGGKDEGFQEPNPKQYEFGQKIKKVLKDILKE